MIMARTGHDWDFNSKIDKFTSLAIACFHDPKYPVGKEIPSHDQERLGFFKIIRNVKNAIHAKTLQASIAKTICSCHLVSRIDIPSCFERNYFDFSKWLTKVEVKKSLEYDGSIGIQVQLSRFARLFKLRYGDAAIAYYHPDHPEYGCQLK